MQYKLFGLLAAIFLFSNISYSQMQQEATAREQAGAEIAAYLKPLAAINVSVTIDSVQQNGNILDIHLSKLASDYPYRDNTVSDIYSIVKKYYPDKQIKIYANGSTIEELASKFYSSLNNSNGKKQGSKKGAKGEKAEGNLVTDLSRPYDISNGMQNRHIALWHSHGYYYAQQGQRWEWQRAPLFQTVEDMYTMGYVLPFLVPMLENAGANVLMPRERDCQANEVIVDNDCMFGGYYETSGSNVWKNGDSVGFANPKEFYVHGENPFRMGTYRVAGVLSLADVKGKAAKEASVAKWIPDVPQTREYAVYVSYKTLPNSTDAAYYTVKYKGGEREFKVNQTMGGGTWIYLGTFLFDKGSKEQGVYLTNLNKGLKAGKNAKVVTADAVKFGGGMGNIARRPADMQIEEQTSGYARFIEGSRYWLQWAGFADTVYSYTNNTNDYTDDYVSRGRWVNTISGGSKVNPEYKGLNIPVDLSFAFHTDAGSFPDDSIVGTLMIYTKYSNGSDKYPTGDSRMLAREYGDIMQTQIVDDVRSIFEPDWSRRGLWDRSYAEARTPNVPAVLLEFLSHQNFADMKYGLDPYFRFVVSRAIYKGMLKFLSHKEGIPYIVQPLPVKDFAAVIEENAQGTARVRLTWNQTKDTLEPTAVAKKYVVYTREGDNGFDNGIVVDEPVALINVDANKIYSFKVVAINEGGASFPSEILSVGVANGNFAKNKTVLVVNGFNRVSAPATFQSKDSTIAGFYNRKDYGVPYVSDISFVGEQYEFRRAMPWMDNDASGFGSCYSNYKDKVIAGNTFDYTSVHGKAFMKQGYSFVSVSAGAVMNSNVDLRKYPIVDFIMGKQAGTRDSHDAVRFEVFPVALQSAISEYCKAGGNVLISGTNVATDLWDGYNVTEEGKKFAKEILKYRWMTDYASADGVVVSVANPFGIAGKYSFSTELNDKIYIVESPDALVPASNDSFTIFRYKDNNVSAGVAYGGDYKAVTLGFPIETLESDEQVEMIIKEISEFFEGK